MWQPRGEFEAPIAPMVMPNPLWKALFARGYSTAKELDDLFSPTLQSLKDPFTLRGMQKAGDRLMEAFDKKENVVIYADFDLDGTSGLALLYEGMKGLGFENLSYYQPKRLSEGYGLHVHAVEELAKQNTKVIISIDVGITAIAAAARAKELGVDLIITDHHLPYEELPDAFTIINPNQKECDSGLGYLCGAGVAFFLLIALKKMLAQKNITPEFNLKDVLDFLVVGTLTDLVPLVHDNRVLVKHGLIKLSQTQRPTLRLLMDSLGLKDRILTSQEVAIGLAPKLNALSRMEAEFLPRDVFLEQDISKAQNIVDHVLKTQEIRKTYQKSAVVKAEEMISEMDQKGFVWIWSHEFHKGIIGLVATAIAEKHRVPAFVGSVNVSGEVAGSARLPDGSSFDLTKILEVGKDALMKYGGHAAAAGFSLKLDQTLELEKHFSKFFTDANIAVTEKVFVYDAEAQFEELNTSFMKWLEALEPFGKDFPTLHFLFRKVRVNAVRKLNGGHLKINLVQGGKTLDTLVFFPAEKYLSIRADDVLDLICEIKWNHFNGSKTIQLMTKDFRRL